jgi:hypothetical protein
MAAKNHRFRSVSRRIPVGTARIFALLVLTVFAGSAARSGTQSPPAQQTPSPAQATPPPAQPATQDQNPAPTQPSSQPAPGTQPGTANTQKKAEPDDDWPEPEWETDRKQPGAPANSATQAPLPAPNTPASNQTPASSQSLTSAGEPSIGGQSTSPQTQNNASEVPAGTATPALLPRPAYTPMTPEEKRKQQVADECAYLLKLATDLKTEVDKASKDELSVSVVRKATELEQVAHKVKNGMALSAGNEPVSAPKGGKAQ